MKIKISDIKINEGRRSADYDIVVRLVNSIEQVGLINPITVDVDNVLVAGLHRLEAHKIMGTEYIEANMTDKDDIIKQLIEIDENLIRNEIHFIDEGDLLLTRKEIYLQLHPETGHGAKTKMTNCHLCYAQTFVSDTAEKTGRNARTINRGVRRSEKIIPAVKRLIKDKDMTRSQADDITKMDEAQQNVIVEIVKTKGIDKVDVVKIIKDIKHEEKRVARMTSIQEAKEKINEENLVEYSDYDVLVIDPPWDYTEVGGIAAEDYDPTGPRGITPYPTMPLAKIREIELPLKDDAVVFLWTTHSFIHDAFGLLEAWGLTYKATMVWDKEQMGLGRTIRMQCEFCLLAIKGKPLLVGNGIRDIIREQRREHSRKPNKFFDVVDEMTHGRKLDYFSRETREGWDTYGAEEGKFDG